MITKRAKYLFGQQIHISCVVGSIPFYWDSKNEKLCCTQPNEFSYIKWIVVSKVILLHQFILITKLVGCVLLDCSETWVKTFFHLFWIMGHMFATLFDISTSINRAALVPFINKMVNLDTYLTSK